ncbi:MAG: site-2 protease family protein [Desulfovibrionales bacterium]
MFKNNITLFSILGFKIRINISWIIIAVLITWSLSTGFFPYYYEGLSTTQYWIMGVIGAIGLFASILFHELWHSIIARHYGLPISGITLFLFGGVSEMVEEPKTPKIEFLMAVAGPLSSLVLGFALYGIAQGAETIGISPLVTGIIGYLAIINWIFAVFNMLPAFPLDGGRVLRSALWHYKGDLRWATNIASKAGSFFGILLMIFGLVNLFTGNPIGGMWYFIIGLFLKSAAQMSYQQVMIKQNLKGETVSSLMRTDPITVSPDISVKELVEKYIYRHHFKMYPVVENGNLLGCVHMSRIKEIDREEWESRNVRELAMNCSEENTVSPEEDVTDAMTRMNRTGNSRLMVVENGKLKGILAQKDIMGYLSTRMEMEG